MILRTLAFLLVRHTLWLTVSQLVKKALVAGTCASRGSAGGAKPKVKEGETSLCEKFKDDDVDKREKERAPY